MQQFRMVVLACMAMLAFAGNSLLCRIALKQTSIDPASFTTIRLLSGAAVLILIAGIIKPTSKSKSNSEGDWKSAFALFTYMVTFSFAFVSTTASVGSLILFGAVQTTMIVYTISKGQRLSNIQLLGLAFAYIGLVMLFLPDLAKENVTDANIVGAVLMMLSGIAWGAYSLMGQTALSPVMITRNNFMRATLFALMVSVVMFQQINLDLDGVYLAITSGAVTSGVGYVIWYYALNDLTISTAAVIQLSVPVIAAIGGFLMLDESITLVFLLSSAMIIGGTALVIFNDLNKTSNKS